MIPSFMLQRLVVNSCLLQRELWDHRADKLKTLREKLGDPIMSFEKGNHKMKWRSAMYNDNDSLEENLK